MKKRFITISVIAIITGLAVWFFIFRDAQRYTCRQAIPEDAVFVFETPSFSNIHENLCESNIWKYLKQYPYFSDYWENIKYTDSLGSTYPALRKLVLNRPFAVSYHLLPGNKSDLLYICDLGKMNVIAAFEGALAPLLKDYNIKINHLEYQGYTISETDYAGSKFYYTIDGNLLIASMSRDLVKNAVKSSKIPDKKEVTQYDGHANLYINHRQLLKVMNDVFVSEETDNSYPLSFTNLVLKLNKDNLNLLGDTQLTPQESSLLSALNQVDGASSRIKEIAGNNTAAYCSFSFKSFPELQEILQDNYRKTSPQTYQEYEATLRKVSKFLGISVKEQLTSWIGSEIVLIRPELNSENPLKTVVIAIRSKDIEYAREQLSLLTEQVNRKSPVRFKEISYNEHTINYISMKGFFKLFFGKMFDKLERPYYTFLGDYVVFSNSPAALTNMIKDYVLGHTLANDEKYNVLMNQLNGTGNVNIYINTPNLYSYLYQDMKAESRENLSKNKNAVLSIETIGLQMINKDGAFNTKIIANHNIQAPKEYAVKGFNNELEQLVNDIESGMYYPAIPDSIAVSTQTEFSYENAGYVLKGPLQNGEPSGDWTISKQGNILGSIPHKEGKPDGTAQFFYPSRKQQAEIVYSDGQIEKYRELFEDGTLKAELEYNKGIRHGNARFYYSTGHLLCEGKYKKGQRKGNWQYYLVTGETDKKIKF